MHAMPAIWLDHINLPARDPVRLASWYALKLGLETTEHGVKGPGILINFSQGEPLNAGTRLHFGFRVESKADVAAWADHLNVPIAFDEHDFFAARVTDPDGNLFEIYWDKR